MSQQGMLKKNLKRKEIVGGLVLIVLFVAASFFARSSHEQIVQYLDFGIAGMAVYVLAGVVIALVSPMSIIPLIPIASALWGPLLTALLSVLIWTGEAALAFAIARYLGQPFVARLVDIRTISKYEKILGEKHIFWNIAFMRLALPIDLISYAIGLFTSIKLSLYIAASAAGIIPFAFLVTYASEAPLAFQIFVGLGLLALLYIGFKKVQKRAQAHE